MGSLGILVFTVTSLSRIGIKANVFALPYPFLLQEIEEDYSRLIDTGRDFMWSAAIAASSNNAFNPTREHVRLLALNQIVSHDPSWQQLIGGRVNLVVVCKINNFKLYIDLSINDYGN